MSALISVILPVYNAEKYIGDSIESILNQTYRNFELLIINDASSDKTCEIVESYKDYRIRLITNTANLKVVKSLNKGLELSKGEFIARMDADDIALPERFQRQVDYLNNNSTIDVCATWVHVFGSKNYIHLPPQNHEAIKAALLFHNVIIHPSVMFRRERLVKFDVAYNEAFINAEDYGMWVETIDKLRFGIVPRILLKYRVHDNNISVHKESNWEIIKEMNYKVYKMFFSRIGVVYSKEILALHMKLGFNIIEFLTKNELITYLKWFEKLVAANQTSGYFEKDSFRNEIMEQIIFVAKKAEKSIGTYYAVISTLIKLFSIKQFVSFIPYRLNRRRIYNQNLSILKTGAF